MSTCNAGSQRALRNLALGTHHELNASFHPQRRCPSSSTSAARGRARNLPLRSISHRRSHATLASLSKVHHRKLLKKDTVGKQKDNLPLPNGRVGRAKSLPPIEIKDALARDKNRAWFMHDGTRKSGERHEQSSDDDLIRPSQLPDASKQELALKRQLKQQHLEKQREERRLARKDQKEVETYYKDPIQLANAVLHRLRVPDIDGALRLVVASEPFGIKNVVSWNHCMDWLMSQGQVREALKVYNDMKKRGHMPDAHTYTIMLRGLSEHVGKAGAVKEAVNIYNSIFAPNSVVTPSIIHTNAIINVCARGGDMDALWGVAGRLPEKGPGSPDRLTYTLILNAIRENTIKEAAKTGDRANYHGDPVAAREVRERIYSQAVADGKRLWQDISLRWRRADLVIDEQLVCAMGRLLIGCGVGKDIELVLDLVETTMNLRIAERKLGSAPLLGSGAEPEQDVSEGSLPLQESTVYAQPAQRTLAMILEACHLHQPIRNYASSYWVVLTSPKGKFKIEPDATNVMSYLRILRLHRASSRIYEMLTHPWPESVAKKLYRRGVFVIAFSTCLRDKNNPNVFSTAQKLLKLMREKLNQRAMDMYDEDAARSDLIYPEYKKELMKKKAETRNMSKEELEDARRLASAAAPDADPKILDYFVQLGVATTHGWHEGLRGKDDGTVFERDPTKNPTMIALQMAAPYLTQLKRSLKLKLDSWQEQVLRKRDVEWHLKDEIEEMVGLIRSMISAYDRVVDIAERLEHSKRGGIDNDLITDFNLKKREYTAYIARVERVTGRANKAADAFETDDAELASDAGDAEPWIERRVSKIFRDVDDQLIRRRKGPKPREDWDVMTKRQKETRLKIMNNRKLQAQRETLLGNEIRQEFPEFDYGVLDKDLNLVTGSDREVLITKQDMNLRRMPQKSLPKWRQASRTASGLEDESDWMKRRVDKTERAGAGWLLKQQRSSILDREDVKKAWLPDQTEDTTNVAAAAQSG